MLTMLILETIYMFLIVLPSLLIFWRIQRLYHFSKYHGMQYLSLGFLMLAAGFVARYIVMLTRLGDAGTIQELSMLTTVMSFLIVLAGFFLLYSTIWQKMEKRHYGRTWMPIALLGALSLLVACVDQYRGTLLFMYLSQILVFSFAASVSLQKYLRKRNNYRQLYFISMTLFLFVWIINAVAQYTIDAFPFMRLYAYAFTVAACTTMLFIVIKLTRDRS